MIVRIKNRRVRQIISGNLWVFRSDIVKIENENSFPGSFCRLEDKDGNYIASGYYNRNSEIRVRILTYDSSITSFEKLIIERIKTSIMERDFFVKMRNIDGVRLVNSEGDFLPGLIIDKFSNICVVQINSAGMAHYVENISQFLLDNISETVIVRGDSSGLKREGIELENMVLGKKLPEFVQFKEDGILSNFRPLDSQKTGAYLDIREPRMMMKYLSQNCDVLDCFCNSGLFGLHALQGGAASVTFVESGNGPIELLKKNIMDNNFSNSNIEIVKENVFNILSLYEETKKLFDIVILDPPPFVKKRADLHRGMRGYYSLIIKGLKVVKSGGILVIATCSAPVKEEIFINSIVSSLKNSKNIVKMIKYGVQDMDHPYIPVMEETNYLRYYILRKM